MFVAGIQLQGEFDELGQKACMVCIHFAAGSRQRYQPLAVLFTAFKIKAAGCLKKGVKLAPL